MINRKMIFAENEPLTDAGRVAQALTKLTAAAAGIFTY